jgi:hypothetical protein
VSTRKKPDFAEKVRLLASGVWLLAGGWRHAQKKPDFAEKVRLLASGRWLAPCAEEAGLCRKSPASGFWPVARRHAQKKPDFAEKVRLLASGFWRPASFAQFALGDATPGQT